MRKVALLVLDGAGYSEDRHGNPVNADEMPNFFGALEKYGFAQLEACGEAVGLEAGQVGNSEVGHLTIGAGRTVLSMTRRLAAAYADGSWARDPAWQAIGRGERLHLVGLLSDAGIHALVRTFLHAAKIASDAGVSEIVVHPVLDGNDSAAGTAPALMKELQEGLAQIPGTQLGVVMGRKWFCDRSGDLDLTRVVIDALENAPELPSYDSDKLEAHLASESELSFPAHCAPGGTPLAVGDPILVTNHRADRARQVIQVLSESRPVYTVMDPGQDLSPEHIFFPLQILDEGFAYEIKRAGISSSRIAEKCKFPHVTFFFNGFNAGAEGRGVCVPSVAEHEIAGKPEMAIAETLNEVIGVLRDPDEQVLITNICNLDQVGHLGRLDLATQAAHAVDHAFAEIVSVAKDEGWSIIACADHGCGDQVLTPEGAPFGSHTFRKVPLVGIPAPGLGVKWDGHDGTLANIAASCLDALALPVPEFMETPLLRFVEQ